MPVLESLAEKRKAPLVLALLGALLFLPLLGSVGLWDPYEVHIADLAKEILASGSWSWKPHVGVVRPPLSVWWVLVGFKTLGIGELGGRLPLALSSLVTVVASWYAGSAVIRRRGAWLGAVALATMPAFFLGARQLTNGVLPVLAATLAFGGLVRAAWPRASEEATDSSLRLVHLALGLGGLWLGQAAGGTMIGVLPVVAALAAALIVGGGPLPSTVLASAGSIAAIVLVCIGYTVRTGGGGAWTLIVGGTPHPSSTQIELTTMLKQVGFGAFPWVALLPLGAARAFSGDAVDEAGRRERFGRVAVLAWLVATYVAQTMHAAWTSEVQFIGWVPIALLAGDYLDAIAEDAEPQGLAALVAAMGGIILAHDFFLQPEHLIGAHLVEAVKWPGPLVAQPYVILALGVLWSLAVGGALYLRPRAGLGGRQGLLVATMALGLVTAATTIYWILPAVSAHLSYKELFTKYKALGGADGELGQYHMQGHSTPYYNKGKSTDLTSLPQLFEFLAKPGRVFVIVNADDMAPIDQYARSQQPPRAYYVVDDKNSRFVLLSNQLKVGESDLNPLRRQVVDKLPRAPQHEVHADFDGKIELVGYDLQPELERGRNFKVTLYYKVNAPVGGAYKVFLHFDGPGNRFNGDHVPLDGKFPTNYWVPGYYIIDEHEMEPDRTTTVPGWYQIYTGFWLGDQRLKAITGANDGENRVKIGAVRVK